MMTKDTVMFGTLIGFAGNVPKLILAWIFHFMGYLRYTFEQIAAGMFVPSDMLDDPVSIAIGVIADWTMAGILGILILTLIRKTGNDYPVFKAIMFTLAEYIFLYGALMAFNVTRASLATPLPNFLLFFPHLLYGITVGYAIQRYDKERVR